MSVDKALILRTLKGYKKMKSDADFALFLGVSPSNLRKWYERNTFNLDKLCALFPEIDTNWMLTGEGAMFKDPKNPYHQLTEREIEEVSTLGINNALMKMYQEGVLYPAIVHEKILAEKNSEIAQQGALIQKQERRIWELERLLELK